MTHTHAAASASKKRKLSTSSHNEKDAKKPKAAAASSDATEPESGTILLVASGGDLEARNSKQQDAKEERRQGTGEDALESPGADEEVDNQEPSRMKLRGPGPHVMYIWCDAFISMMDGDDAPVVPLKSSALDAFRKISHLPKEKHFVEIGPHLDELRHWQLSSPEDSDTQDDPGAKALSDQMFENGGSQEDDEDGDEVPDEEQGGWYEVTLQRARPADGLPQKEVELDGNGRWWMTKVQEADREGHRAMICIIDHIAGY